MNNYRTIDDYITSLEKGRYLLYLDDMLAVASEEHDFASWLENIDYSMPAYE
jgi:hypothetical protein